MTKLPVVSGDECISALNRLGYQEARTRGSHVWLVCRGRAPVPVPKHKELGKGILRKILRTADITVDEFNKLLKGYYTDKQRAEVLNLSPLLFYWSL